MSYESWRSRARETAGKRIFERRPFIVTQDYASAYNTERLPDIRETALSYRAARMTDTEAARFAVRYIGTRLLLVPLFVAIALYSAKYLPSAELIGGSIGLVGALLGFFFLRERRLAVLARTVAYPVLAILAARLIIASLAVIPEMDKPQGVPNDSFGGAPLGFTYFSVIVVIAFFNLLRVPEAFFAFGWKWIISNHRVRFNVNHAATRKWNYSEISALASWWQKSADVESRALVYLSVTACGIFLVLGGAQLFRWPIDVSSYGIAFAILGALGSAVCCRSYVRRSKGKKPSTSLDPALLGHFLSYDTGPTGLPGVWRPLLSLRARRFSVLAYLVVTSTTFFAAGLRSAATRPETPQQQSEATTPSDGISGYFDRLSTTARLGIASSGEALQDLGGALLLAPFLLLPLMVLPALLLVFCHTVLERWSTRREVVEPEPYDLDSDRSSSDWDLFVERLGTSDVDYPSPAGPVAWSKAVETIQERNHLFLGFEPDRNTPILLDRALLREHTYIVGDSGSGKTSLGILPLVLQLMRGEKAPILILDMKGERGLLGAVKREADVGQRRFLHFTPEEGQPTYPFNPFPDLGQQKRGLTSFCNLVLDALSLNHGEGYGRGYFTARNRHFLYTILQKHDPKSFDELYKVAADEAKKNKSKYQDAFELIAVLQMLADYDQLQVLPSTSGGIADRDTISMERLIEEDEIAYFWLPAATESISVREIGKLALFSLLSAAIARQQKGLPTKTVYVVIDEFQRIAGDNFSILLEQARSFGVSLILANQTINDLNTPSRDLRPTIRTNTRVKLSFSVPEPEEIKNLSFLSGEDVVELSSRSVSKSMESAFPDRTETVSFQERMIPRLTPQDIQRHGDHPLEFIAHISRGSGLSQFAGLPVPVRAIRPMSRNKYEAITALPWPDGPMVTPLAAAPAAPNPVPPFAPPGTSPPPQTPPFAPPGTSPPPQTPPFAPPGASPPPKTRPRTPGQKDAHFWAKGQEMGEQIWEDVMATGYYEFRPAAAPEPQPGSHAEKLRKMFDEQE